MWNIIYDGKTIGTNGSENGTIEKDEEFNDLARITLEKCEKYYAITCGVDGMVHTIFCDNNIVYDTEELVRVNEKIIAMENLLENLYESEIKLDDELLNEILDNKIFIKSKILNEWQKECETNLNNQ